MRELLLGPPRWPRDRVPVAEWERAVDHVQCVCGATPKARVHQHFAATDEFREVFVKASKFQSFLHLWYFSFQP